ncbi:MAG: TylF/MycF family methyltransferase [Treponema sp.]|nr:TylF/MycF family methyltransferase [Treponema sp.]
MNVYVWGTGRLVGKVVGKYIDLNSVKAFIDNDKNKKNYMDKPVVHPTEIHNADFDVILVANLFRKEIRKQCIELGIDLGKVVFAYENCDMVDVNQDYDFVEKALGKDFADVIKNRYHAVRGVDAYGNLCFAKSKNEGYFTTDYVRMKSFELAVKEMRKRNVYGNVAEVGVFRGEFAQYINEAFPEKKLYLFDTFDGFDTKEALKEMEDGHATKAFVEAYKQTSVGIVLQKMKYLDNVVVKQGFFPQSLNGLEDVFAFVSIDCDFEDSIYECLEYFYPRLTNGGYLFVHDYNSDLRGVENAVDRYERDNNIILCKMPLCDCNGTLVITK